MHEKGIRWESGTIPVAVIFTQSLEHYATIVRWEGASGEKVRRPAILVYIVVTFGMKGRT
jgi:hypothetical protein